MHKPSFAVVTFVVTVLAVVALITRVLQPQIPPPEPNRLEAQEGGFLRQGSRQRIDWRPMQDETMALARRLGRPVLLLIGTEWSRYGRQVDAEVFVDQEVAAYVNRNFVPARIDGTLSPEWLSAYLPISRASLGFQPGFQIWTLDPQGRMMNFIGRTNATQRLDSNYFLTLLSEVRAAYDRVVSKAAGEPLPGSGQTSDLEAILSGIRQPLPAFDRHMNQLMELDDPNLGGFVVSGVQPLMPNPWRYQLMYGGPSEALQRSLDAYLLSPMMDLIDGGSFRLSSRDQARRVEFDKPTLPNAELAETLAMCAQTFEDSLYRYMALRALDCVLIEMRVGNTLSAGRIGDEDRQNRSRRVSLSPRRMREILSPSDREWAMANLGLSAYDNPQMVPYLKERRVLERESAKLERVLAWIRQKAPDERRFAASGLLYVDGFAVARSMRAARLLGSWTHLEQAVSLMENLDLYRTGEDVRRSLTSGVPPYLGDYLAYADAGLQDFLATGRVVSLENGLRVLRRALFVFAGPVKGYFASAVPSTSLLSPVDVNSPEVLDVFHESCTAQIIRLCKDYARLLGSEGRDLNETAASAVSRYGGLLDEAGPSASGYFCGAASVMDDTHVLVQGPGAVETANALARLLPVRLVAPAVGPVRPDLRAKGPGIYVVEPGRVLGPMSEAAAVQRLRGPLRIAGDR